MNRDFNPKILRELDRLCIYKCSKCSRIVYLGFDAKDSKMPVRCKACQNYVDGDQDILGDSWYPDEYPEVRFTIDEDSDKNEKPMLIVWFHMECRDCNRMSWIAWRGRWFDYTTCICHEPIKEEAPNVMTIVSKPVIENIIIENLVIPGELVELLKDHCFEHDTTKKAVIIHALRRFLENVEDGVHEDQTAKFAT